MAQGRVERTIAEADSRSADAAAGGDPVGEALARPLSDLAMRYLSEYHLPKDTSEVVYLSTPITTGPRLLAWLAENRPDEANPARERTVEVVREEVIEENIARLGPIRKRIEAEYSDSRLIDPTTLMVPGWTQGEYHRFWVEVLNRCADRIVFADGWQLSTGCTIEYAAGLELGLPMEDSSGSPVLPEAAARLLREAALELEAAHRDSSVALAAAERATKAATSPHKDAHLAALAESYNVASFVSFAPYVPYLRYRILPDAPLPRGAGLRRAAERLLEVSKSGSVNVRTFRLGETKGNPFYYGLAAVDDIVARVRASAAEGYYCIVNETIDIHDGGVSGVSLGGVVEFAPDDTPRSVEKEDTARLPVDLSTRILGTVYGDAVAVPAEDARRIEFSVHPVRVGQRREPVIVWEAEDIEPIGLDAVVQWPNRFSRLLGDKTYGLLIADSLGMPVPSTTVISRRVAPFRFGRSTKTGEWWMRTAPATQTPGHFTTTRGWIDPFDVLAREDRDGAVAAVLAQEGVDALYSGATLPLVEGAGHVVEGVAGAGDEFMLGGQSTVPLPLDVENRVRDLLARIEGALRGAVRIEWAADEEVVWVLQLHRVTAGGQTGVFSPGDPSRWLRFDPSQGLDALQELISVAKAQQAGIEVTKPVGLTSHVGDLLRKAKVPGRLAIQAEAE